MWLLVKKLITLSFFLNWTHSISEKHKEEDQTKAQQRGLKRKIQTNKYCNKLFSGKHQAAVLKLQLIVVFVLLNPPHSLRFAARFDHSKGLRAAPVPKVQLVVGGDEKELGCGVEGQRGDGHVALCEPAFTATLQEEERSNTAQEH